MVDGVTFARSEEQVLLASTLREMLSTVEGDALRELSLTETAFDRDTWSTLCEMGLIGMALPSSVGGADAAFADLAVLFEELGRVVAAVPALSTVLQSDALPAQATADWAKVDYLQRQIGWEGIGRIVQQLGRSQSLDAALIETLGMDAEAFDKAWLTDWRQRIRQTTADLSALLMARQDAVVGNDEAAFLQSIDANHTAILADELGRLLGGWLKKPNSRK